MFFRVKRRYNNAKTLSNYAWDIKEKQVVYPQIKWEIMKKNSRTFCWLDLV